MENPFNLYQLIGVQKEATQAEITKAYRLMALKVHPDKNPSDYENAQKNFQKLNEAYNILHDPKRRQIYDLTGETENIENFFETYEYYRGIYPKINPEDIDAFAGKYKGSSEEVEDLVSFYLEKNGNMREILFFIPLSQKSDLDRFWKILDDLIEAKKIPKQKAYLTSKKKVKDLKADKDEIIESEQKNQDFEALVLKIKGKQNNDADKFFSYLEEKYSEKPKKRKKK